MDSLLVGRHETGGTLLECGRRYRSLQRSASGAISIYRLSGSGAGLQPAGRQECLPDLYAGQGEKASNCLLRLLGLTQTNRSDFDLVLSSLEHCRLHLDILVLFDSRGEAVPPSGKALLLRALFYLGRYESFRNLWEQSRGAWNPDSLMKLYHLGVNAILNGGTSDFDALETACAAVAPSSPRYAPSRQSCGWVTTTCSSKTKIGAHWSAWCNRLFNRSELTEVKPIVLYWEGLAARHYQYFRQSQRRFQEMVASPPQSLKARFELAKCLVASELPEIADALMTGLDGTTGEVRAYWSLRMERAFDAGDWNAFAGSATAVYTSDPKFSLHINNYLAALLQQRREPALTLALSERLI